jgi:arylsulfatase A-like enzyme
MLLTGRSLFRVGGQTGEMIPGEQTTLPECLRQNGYQTHHIGKWHQDRASFQRSFCGGDRIFGFTPGWYVQYGGHWNVAVHDFDPTGNYAPGDGYLLGADKQTHVPLQPGLGGVHSSEMFSDAAISFLNRQGNAERGTVPPFFLYLAYVAPHDPRQSPEEYEKRYEADQLETPANFIERHPFDNGEFSVRDEMLEAWPRRPHAIRRHLADYYACIEHLDHHIGRVLSAVKANGLDENTMIVFASDNGLAIGSHGLMGKQNLYEHSVRVPLIFAGPGIPRGQTRDDFCYLLDVYPTLCGCLDLAVPPSVEGCDLAGTLRTGCRGPRQTLFHAYRSVQRAVRDGRYKLIEYVTDQGRQTQLFDLVADPGETNNLAEAPDHAAVKVTLRAVLQEQRRQWGDTRELESGFWCGFDDANHHRAQDDKDLAELRGLVRKYERPMDSVDVTWEADG